MPIESSFALISDLNATYPTGTDFRKDGDNHIRGLKAAVKGTFPNVNAAITASDEDINALAGIAADPVNTLNAGGLLPTGVICMWGGLIANIPAGWSLCDGTAGTPDLRDRFILATGLDDMGAGGGSSHVVTSSASGAHTHGSGATQGTALTEAQLPSHGHPFAHCTTTQSSTESGSTGGLVTSANGSPSTRVAYNGTPGAAAGNQIGGTGAGATHSHVIDTSATHTHTVNTRGKHYKLAFIQKV